MTKIFNRKKDILNNVVSEPTEDIVIKDYNTFLDSVDELTQTRLNSIDLSLTIQKEQFKIFGVTLTEVDCTNEIINIKRNQNGFYPDETKSLNSNQEYDNYMASLEFFEDHKEDLEVVHELISDKEEILRGCYIVKKGNEEELEELINDLGYGIVRKKQIYEANPEHPSKEYNHLLELMDDVNNPKKINDTFDEIMEHIRSLYSKEVDIKIKTVKDKYDIDLDNSYGIILLNPFIGDKKMLYAVNGFDVYKDRCDKYLIVNDMYLEVYLKLATSCIKSKYLKK